MSKTSSIYTRVEPQLKEQVEDVLGQLGIPVANAINLFLHQIVIHRGIPFEVKLPHKKPIDFVDDLSRTELDAELEKAVDDLEAGRTMTSKQVRENMQRKYNA
ncbi:MAG: type II toxin-antitoxin system RelB/DinJ family antitoxin [Oscillospiraceae bacterium]|nr:type II toxin-antitoxin system RelB/DinJ family antitoxin [Oscillospiraceae bacterium]